MIDHHDPEWVEAYQQLDTAVTELHRLIERDSDDNDSPSIPCDYLLLVGSMFMSGSDRAGGVDVFPKHGSQPAYITTGLIESARWALNRAESED